MDEKYGIELDLLTSAFEKKANKIKKQAESIQQAFNPSDASQIKISGLDNVKKEISGMSNEFKRLTGQKFGLENVINAQKYKAKVEEVKQATESLKQETSSIGYVKYNSNDIQKFINNYTNGIGQVKRQITGFRGTVEQDLNPNSSIQNRWNSFFDSFKNKISQVKSSMSGIKTSFNGMPKITVGISNNIKSMSNGLKKGLGTVLKYVGALVGLRSIYNTLRNSASSWLSSQNAGAQQLSANIEYLKYAMRKCICTCYSVYNKFSL